MAAIRIKMTRGRAGYNESENFRYNLAWMLDLSRRMNLLAMRPRGDLCSAGYCLSYAAASGAEYLVYMPSGDSASVNFSATTRTLSPEWFNPANGQTTAGSDVAGGPTRSFTVPFGGPAVLHIVNGVGTPLPPPSNLRIIR
jgi:hypothetical protein